MAKAALTTARCYPVRRFLSTDVVQKGETVAAAATSSVVQNSTPESVLKKQPPRQRRKNNKKKIEFFRFIIRSITWAIPSAVIVCIIDIIIGDGLSEEMRMAIFGFTFFVGMIGEEIAIIFTNMRIWIKVSKEIIKELGECIGKADICKTIGDTIEDEMNKELEKEDK